MTADRSGIRASATNDPLQLRAQRLTRQLTLFLMPALATVASARVACRVKAGKGARADALSQEQVAQGLCDPARAIVLFDDHHALLFLEACDEVGWNLVEGKHTHAPDLEIVEQRLIAQLVQVAHDRPHSNDDALFARLDLPPRRERRHLSWNCCGGIETQ